MSEFKPSLVGEALLRLIPEQFGDVPHSISRHENPIIVFPNSQPVLDGLYIDDDNDEATVHAGDITHGHFGCYDDRLSEVEKAEHIAGQVSEFLTKVFNDEIEFRNGFWGGGWGPRGSARVKSFSWAGGWRPRGSMDRKCFVWSGKIER